MRLTTATTELHVLRCKDTLRIDPERLCEDALISCVLPGRANLYVRGSGLCAVVVARGSIELSARDGQFMLARGDWLVLSADAALKLRCDEHCLAAVISAGAQVPVRDRHGMLVAQGRGRIDLASLRLLRSALSACDDIGRGADAEAARSMLLDTFAQLAPPLEEIRRCPGRTVQRKREIYARLQRARLYIEGHPNEIPRVGDLAEMSRFSPWYFTKAFTDVFGLSPQAFGRRFRLEHARRSLTASTLSIAEVAASSGFENASAFARAFHQQFGATASELRRRQRTGQTG